LASGIKLKMKRVSLTIDGIRIEAERDAKILWAALDNGIYIPNLCAIRERELPFGGCRLCFVEVEGKKEAVAACVEPVREGMVVETKTPRVERLRRTAFELLIADHPVECRTCGKSRRCELQKLASALKIKLRIPQRLRELPRKSLPLDSSNPFYIYDPNKCILCGKCVWACSDLGIGAIDFAFRGYESRVTTFDSVPLKESRCESYGECVAICPVGALLPKNCALPTQEVKTICPYCNIGCGLYLGIREGELTGVRGDDESPVNKGRLCVRGRFGLEFIQHPDRLSSPLIKRKGKFSATSWEEAIELVAHKLASYKGEQIAVISSVKCTNEASYLLQKFARTVLDTPNIDNPSRYCQLPSIYGLAQSTGIASTTIDEIAHASCMFVVGANVTNSHPIIAARLRKAAHNGAHLIVANPREVGLCRDAHLWLQPRPGSDLILLMGLMRVLIDEGLAQHGEGFDALRDSMRGLELEKVERVTGVPREKVAEAARIYARSRPAIILYGTGITQHAYGTDNVLAIANLAMLTGSKVSPLSGQNNSQGAGDMGTLSDFYPGYQPVEAPGLTLAELPQAIDKGQVKALYIIGANPALSMPDALRVQDTLKKLEFLVVQDIFLTETAGLSQVVLPAASFAEIDGTFTNIEGRVQRVHKTIEPIGSSRPDWWIVGQIAKKLGGQGFDFQHPSQIMEEIEKLVPSYGGISYEKLEGGGLLCPAEEHQGRIIPLVPWPLVEPPDKLYPLILTTERSLYHQGTPSRTVAGLNLLRAEELVEINPTDATALGIADGEMVQVVSRRGKVTARARVTPASPPGLVCMTPHFFESPTNVLTHPADLKTCAIRLEKSYNIPKERINE
jgi:predicted molibdopterin-dependent oxidoreductase YjgC